MAMYQVSKESIPQIMGRVLFFDQFDVQHKAFMEIPNLMLSVAQHVQEILSTRCGAKKRLALDFDEDDLDIPAFFGLPELLFQESLDSHTTKKWQESVQELIARFEPRLIDPVVKLVKKDINTQRIFLEIQAKIEAGPHHTPVDFPVVVMI